MMFMRYSQINLLNPSMVRCISDVLKPFGFQKAQRAQKKKKFFFGNLSSKKLIL